MLTFIGFGRINSKKLDEVKQAIRKYMKTIQNENGTPEYVVYQHSDDPCSIVFYEKYMDQSAKEQHNKNPALKEMMAVIRPALEGDVTKGFVDIIAEKQQQNK